MADSGGEFDSAGGSAGLVGKEAEQRKLEGVSLIMTSQQRKMELLLER